MRRYLIILMMPCFVMLFGICCLAGCEGSRHHLKKVRLNEVAHSIFYAPQYVAIEKGYFEKELNWSLLPGLVQIRRRRL